MGTKTNRYENDGRRRAKKPFENNFKKIFGTIGFRYLEVPLERLACIKDFEVAVECECRKRHPIPGGRHQLGALLSGW